MCEWFGFQENLDHYQRTIISGAVDEAVNELLTVAYPGVDLSDTTYHIYRAFAKAMDEVITTTTDGCSPEITVGMNAALLLPKCEVLGVGVCV